MIALLALRNFAHRPWRSALLFAGYGIGVSVMIVLLSIAEALVTQARDERLVGGGDITVLPDGVDVEVLKTGGLGGLFFSIANARFVYLQLLASPRLAPLVSVVSPQVEGKLLYLRTSDGVERPVRASADLPSATGALRAGPLLAAGTWTSDDGDRRWASPSLFELRHDIDHFHLPPAGLSRPGSWGEWHYVNVLSPDRRRWTFISFIVAGNIRGGQYGGQVLVTTHEQGGRSRRFSATVPANEVRFSVTDADVRIGGSSVTVLPDGRYALHATVREERGTDVLTLDLIVEPAPYAYFPGATLESGDFASGYAVAGVRADASGTICVHGRCDRYDRAQSYKDHNWGVWQGVTWEWGMARLGSYSLLYGRVQPPDSVGATSPLFVYLVDSSGFRALFRPRSIDYEDARAIIVGGREVRVPARATLYDVRGTDTLRLDIDVEDAVGTDTRLGLAERGEASYARGLTRPFFIQMKGRARLTGRAGGAPIAGEGAGFFETYR